MNIIPIKKRNIIIGDSINNENYIGKPLYLYQIRNTVNSMKYVGISYNLEKRIEQHLSSLRKGKHVCDELQKDFKKFGEESFVSEIIFETIFVSSDQKALIERLAILTMNNLYNTNNYSHKFKQSVNYKKAFIVNERDKVVNPYKGLKFKILLKGNSSIPFETTTPDFLKSKEITSFRICGIKEFGMLLYIRSKLYKEFKEYGFKLKTKYSEDYYILYCKIFTT